MLNISTADQNKLFAQSQLKSLQNNSYLTNSNNENFQYIKKKFFSGEVEDKAKLLNVGSGLFSTVSETISYYVGKPQVDISIDIKKYVDDYVALWYATIGLIRQDWKLETEYQPAKNYRNDNGVDKILRLYTKEDEGNINLYMLVTEYGVWYIENKLYQLSWNTYKSTDEVWLDTLPQTSILSPRVETWLDIPALLVVKDDELEQYPTSLLEKIKSIVYAIDRSIVMQHTEFLKNVESFVLFKDVRRPQKLLTDYNAGKKIDFSSVWRVINGSNESSIEFVNNTNDLIIQSIEDNENNVRRVSAMTDVPLDFLGIESSDWAIGANSRTLKQWSFVKRIQGIRDLFDKYIAVILEIGGYKEEITRPDILAKSSAELADELTVARESQIISQFEAIKRYNNRDDEQTQIELDRITEEEQISLELTQTNESETNWDNSDKPDNWNSKTESKQDIKK